MKTRIRSMATPALAAVVLMCLGPTATAGEAGAVEAQQNQKQQKEIVVLVAPFENLSTARAMIQYEVASSPDPNAPKRSFRVDRYTEAPRSILEDILGEIPGLKVVERQRLDSILLEAEFGRLSGLVDPDKAVKLGKMLGADAVVMGTILDVGQTTRRFSGYGVSTHNTQVRCSIRVRVIDIGSGAVAFSRVVRDSVTYPSSQFGEVTDSDVAYGVIESTLENLRGDEEFKRAVFGRKTRPGPPEPAPSPPAQAEPGKVEVEFAPVPENCDIEIDGVYVGGSPLKHLLPVGQEVKVRISKAGHLPWETRIVARPGLRITKELEPVREPEKPR